MPADQVLIVEPRSFCAGVESAIKALAWMVLLEDEPVFCVHEIVHNQAIVERFERLGVEFVDDVALVPAGAPVVLSAHGSAPEVVARARARSAVVVDAVCPLVTKVHHEVRARASLGNAIIYAGHRGHDEAVAAVAIAPGSTHVVASAADVDALALDQRPVALLAQTTLGMDAIDAIEGAVRRRFSDVWTPRRADLCYATTNRQRAVRAASERCDVVVVVGSASSANTSALVDLARRMGRRAHRVDGVADLPADLHGTIAVTAGASAPETAVKEVVAALAPPDRVVRFAPITEDEYFPLPPVLRSVLARAGESGRLTPEQRDAATNDRSLPALALLELVESWRLLPIHAGSGAR